MSRMRWIATSLIVLLLCLSSCVELTGQRVSWTYDQAADELRILLCYDGIHEANRDAAFGSSEKGADQIPEFMKNGDALFMDWPGTMRFAEWKATAGKAEASPQDREYGEIARAVSVFPVGYYREPDGRIGAAQSIVIKNPREVLKH